ncbi:MAG: hypothetical protein AB3N23_00735 [Paracoccaceae bacterium]
MKPTFCYTTRPLAPADTARGAGETVAEIVTFRLADGTTQDAFTKAAQAMEPFLIETGSMHARVLSVDADGLWTDHLVWSSMTAAKTAAEQIMARPEAQPFMSMIDPATVTMRHAPIRVTQN